MRKAKTPEGPFSVEFQLPDPTRERWALNESGEYAEWGLALDEARCPAEHLPDLSVVRILAARRPVWVGVVEAREAVPLRMTPATAARLARQWQGRGATPASMLDGAQGLRPRDLAGIAAAIARACEPLLTDGSDGPYGARAALRRAEEIAAGAPLSPGDSVAGAKAALRELGRAGTSSRRLAGEACWNALLTAIAPNPFECASLTALSAAAAHAWSIEAAPAAHDRRNRLADARMRDLATVARSVVSLGQFLRASDAVVGATSGARPDRSRPVGSLARAP